MGILIKWITPTEDLVLGLILHEASFRKGAGAALLGKADDQGRVITLAFFFGLEIRQHVTNHTGMRRHDVVVGCIIARVALPEGLDVTF